MVIPALLDLFAVVDSYDTDFCVRNIAGFNENLFDGVYETNKIRCQYRAMVDDVPWKSVG